MGSLGTKIALSEHLGWSIVFASEKFAVHFGNGVDTRVACTDDLKLTS